MQTQANKNKNSVKIRLKLAADNPLNPGKDHSSAAEAGKTQQAL